MQNFKFVIFLFIFEVCYTNMIIMRTIHSTLPLQDIFPLCTEQGSDCSGVNYQKIRFLGEHGPALTQSDISLIMDRHHEFLASGGAGGQWKVLQIGDLVAGFYDVLAVAGGQQAMFERMNLSNISLELLEFPFANFCGAFGLGLKANNANLSHCLFTDSTLENADFSNANLQYVDFSRANLRGVSFKGANLKGVDFENCNLNGADFSSARFSSARFPGAKLANVSY